MTAKLAAKATSKEVTKVVGLGAGQERLGGRKHNVQEELGLRATTKEAE